MPHFNDAQSSMFVLALSAALIALTVSYSVDAEPLSEANTAPATTLLALAAPAAIPFEPPTLAPSAIVLNAVPAFKMEEGTLKIYFGPGKTELAIHADRALEDIVHAVQNGQRVKIAGFHDQTGNPQQNIVLSKRRAQVVQKRLIAMGVPAKAIELAKPSVSQPTIDDALARRVEVSLIGAPAIKSAQLGEASLEEMPMFRQEEGMVKLYFAPSKTELLPAFDSALSAMVQAANNGKQLQVSGFHDATGNPKQNLLLSQKRAQAVQKRLIALGVPAKAIEIKRPSVAPSTDSHVQARRVEVAVLH